MIKLSLHIRFIGLLLLTSPFIIGWLLLYFLHPTDFWEMLASLVFIFLVCIAEGIFAWIIGLSMLFRG